MKIFRSFSTTFSRLAAVVGVLAILSLRSHAQDVQGLTIPFKLIQVPSPVLQEIIDTVLVEEGVEVKEGQVLVQLRNAKELLLVQESERLVENAEFQAKGLESLFNQKMGSKEASLKAKTELELAKIRLALAKEQLNEKTIRAKIDGVVVKKYKEAGESIDRGEKLIDIVNFDQVYVQFYLDPKLMQTLSVGQPIGVRFPVLNDSVFNGKIDFIDPRIDASSGLFRVRVLIENHDRKIKPGMRGAADFTTKKRP